jgi:hydroxymethylbilane synthase
MIGTRGSKLALIQAEAVAAQLRHLHPGIEVKLRRIVTEGDRNQSVNLDEAGGIGVFVKALEQELIKGTIDIAVHSLKDLPTELPAQLCLATVAAREDPRDALVARFSLDALPLGATIGTGSLRRAIQLKSMRPDLKVCGLRGNVDTRLRKVSEGVMDGIVVAAAAMNRLELAGKITQYLPENEFIPAVGQGAIAIEAKLSATQVLDMVKPLDHVPSRQAVTAERAFLHALGGGCRAPIAALATINGTGLTIRGMIADSEGRRILKDSLAHLAEASAEAGELLARRMLDSGGAAIISGVRCR